MAAKSGVQFLARDSLPALAYTKVTGAKSPGVIYVPGFMSGMGGTKAVHLQPFLTQLGHSFIRYDPTGLYQSKSAGDPARFSFRQWRDDLLHVIDSLTEGPQLMRTEVLVGSSMGAWLSVLGVEKRAERVGGLLLISSAPDFLRRVYEHKLTPDQQQRLMAGEILEQGQDGWTLNKELVEEGTELEILSRPGGLGVECPVRMVHATGDDVAPTSFATALLDKLDSPDAQLRLLRGGGHRFESPRELGVLREELAALLASLRV